jgi:phosphatidylglycerophosphate synthase
VCGCEIVCRGIFVCSFSLFFFFSSSNCNFSSCVRNLRYSYGPINEFLTKFVAPFVPPAITPNAVTMFSTAMLWPVLWLLARQYFVLAAFLVFIHDMADRLDGSVARARQTSKQSARFPVHDGRLGAFLDAQGDKVFHVGFLIANLLMNNTVWPYKLVAVLVVVAQSVSFVVRCMDYFLPVVGPKDAASGLLLCHFLIFDFCYLSLVFFFFLQICVLEERASWRRLFATRRLLLAVWRRAALRDGARSVWCCCCCRWTSLCAA